MRQTQNASKKDNRKSILVIGLLLLLVAVIGFGGYTLSKYVTKKSVKDNNAQVAKWGFNVTADATNLFGKEYKYDTKKNASITNSADGTTVTIKGTDFVVAPGGHGEMTFSISGSAEVLAQIEIKIENAQDIVLAYTKGETAGTYSPIKWTLKKNNDDAKTGLSLAELVKAVNTTSTYEANGTEVTDNYTISWDWAYEGTETDVDVLDTLLAMYAKNTANTTNGDYTVNATDTKTTMSFDFSISVTQLQKAA